ncbi:MAG: DUF350 domain-containing protein [Planctomycetota bacterium]
MDWELIWGMSLRLAVNLVYAVASLVVGVLALHWLDRAVLKKIDLEEEIKKGNVAAAVFAGTLLLFVAAILVAALVS